MRVFGGSVHADLCPRDDVAFRAMHAIPQCGSPTEKPFSAPRSRIEVVHRGLICARANTLHERFEVLPGDDVGARRRHDDAPASDHSDAFGAVTDERHPERSPLVRVANAEVLLHLRDRRSVPRIHHSAAHDVHRVGGPMHVDVAQV